ncbi:MAG: SprT family zinc-dependent metalloprotease [Gallionella sp.]|nr:SprT family zinc-dependent metalloprotease [Gallionella sp.]
MRNLITPPGVLARGTSGVSPLLRNDPPAVEQRAALLAGKNVSYTLKRSTRRRSIGLRIDDRGLTVCVPMRASEKWLHSVLQEKAVWVVEKLDGWRTRKPAEVRWADGETIPYKGELLTLRVAQSLFAGPAHRHGSELRVFAVNGDAVAHIEQAVRCWYRREAEQLFAERVAHYARMLDVAPRAIKLSAAKTQWGSCTAQGSVRLNVQLIKLPQHLTDYVVVHELAHLREMNHSAAFWRVVESACSDYARLRKELKAFSLGAE